MILLEVGNLVGLLIFFLAIMTGPPILFIIIGLSIKKKQRQTAKSLFILAGLYLLIGIGICGALLT